MRVLAAGWVGIALAGGVAWLAAVSSPWGSPSVARLGRTSGGWTAALRRQAQPTSVKLQDQSLHLALPTPSQREAVLVVRGPPDGTVYVLGTPRGETDKPLLLPCGLTWVRVGRIVGRRKSDIEWLDPGRTVRLPCGMTKLLPAAD